MVSLIIKYRMFLTSAPSAKVRPTLDDNHCEVKIVKIKIKTLVLSALLAGAV